MWDAQKKQTWKFLVTGWQFSHSAGLTPLIILLCIQEGEMGNGMCDMLLKLRSHMLKWLYPFMVKYCV